MIDKPWKTMKRQAKNTLQLAGLTLLLNPLLDVALAFVAHFFWGWLAWGFAALATNGVIVGLLLRAGFQTQRPHCADMPIEDAVCSIGSNLLLAALPLFGIWRYTLYFTDATEALAFSHSPRYDGADLVRAGRALGDAWYWIEHGDYTGRDEDDDENNEEQA